MSFSKIKSSLFVHKEVRDPLTLALRHFKYIDKLGCYPARASEKLGAVRFVKHLASLELNPKDYRILPSYLRKPARFIQSYPYLGSLKLLHLYQKQFSNLLQFYQKQFKNVFFHEIILNTKEFRFQMRALYKLTKVTHLCFTEIGTKEQVNTLPNLELFRYRFSPKRQGNRKIEFIEVKLRTERMFIHLLSNLDLIFSDQNPQIRLGFSSHIFDHS